MTGRETFERYWPIINFLVKTARLFPLKMRIKIFNAFRYMKGKKGILFRYVFFSSSAKSCGRNVMIGEGVYLFNIDMMEVGNNTSIQPMCYIEARGGLSIGNDVSIAHSTSIMTTSHSFDGEEPIKYQKITQKKVTIHSNVWIGCKVTILMGVTVERGSVIGANSLVLKDVYENSVNGGIPSRQLKGRFN